MRWWRNPFAAGDMPAPHPADQPLNVAVIGSAGTGKSAMLHSINSRLFEVNEDLGHEADVFESLMERPYVSGRLWTLYFTEITSNSHDANRTFAYPSIDIFVVCFVSGDKQSYNDALHKHIPEIRLLRPDGPPVVLVETMNDAMTPYGCRPVEGGLDWTWYASRVWKRTLASMRWQRRAYRLAHPKQLLRKRVKASAPMADGTNPFEWLPDEVILLVISFLHTPDLARLAQTCKRMLRLTGDDHVWPARSRLQLISGVTLAGTHRCSAKTKLGIESLPYVVARAYENAYHRTIQPVMTKSVHFDNAQDIIEQLRLS